MKYSLKTMIVLPHLKCGGTERTASELANYIAKNGGNVTILLMYKKERFYTLHPNIKIIEPKSAWKKLGGFCYIPFLLYFLRKQYKKHHPDVIFALGYIALVLFTSLGIKAKVIVSFRSSPTRVRFPNNRFLNIAYNISHKLMSKRVNGFIAQTNFAHEVFTKKYNCPVITIPNFLRKMKIYKYERLNQVITVGHCSFEKSQHYLIKAFSNLNAPGWKLIIVGDGPKRKELVTLAKNLNIADKVIFTGYQEDVDFYLSQSKIFAFTSIIEGYPNALIEAMATPLPVVSFNCLAGPSDIIINGENGFLVEVGDVVSLTQRLQLLIDDPELRGQIEQRAYTIKFNNAIDKIANNYLSFFTSIAKL